MVYVIGISFTEELLAKTAYEETGGYIFKLMSKNPSANDAVSAKMVREYANFPYQIPWYKFDFLSDVAELEANDPKSLHDKKRQFTLGLEFRMKSHHAKAITKAAKTSGQAKLTIRTIVHDISVKHLLIIKGISVINATNKRTELKTPRYATFTISFNKF